MRALRPLAVALALAIALPAAAWAGPPAQLRQEIVASGGKVTLGDLFENAGEAAGVVAARVQPGRMAVLDATQVQILARSSGVDWGNPAGLRRIVVQPGEAPAAVRATDARLASAPRPARAAAVLAYSHNLNAGDVVRAEDLTWSREAVAGGDAPRDPDAVIGLAARRPLREGDAVAVRDLAAPQVIKRDDLVSVSFAMDGLSLTLQAKALGDAAAGQTVSVQNLASKKIIQAVAAGPGQAVVGPEAEQLKALARASSSRLALR